MKKQLPIVCAAVLLLCCLCACGKTEAAAHAAIETVPGIIEKTPGSEKWEDRVDYGNASNWLMLPESPDKAVDLIYFYPTVFSSEDSSAAVISDIDDAGMRKLAAAALDK